MGQASWPKSSRKGIGVYTPTDLVKGLVVKPCLLTLVVFWGVATPGKWESRLGVNVHTSAECKTDISAVLTVTSGLGPIQNK